MRQLNGVYGQGFSRRHERPGHVLQGRFHAQVVDRDAYLREVCRRFEPVPQVLRSVRFKGGRPLENPAVTKVIAEATARLGDRGRLLVRPSGTEPVIRVMGEADDQALVDALVSDVCEAVASAA